MGRQLLVDSIGVKLSQLTESAEAGEYVFRGKFAQADTPTANKRIYPRKLWERELSRLKSKFAEGKIFGELDHPDDGKTKLQRSAVIITEVNIDKQGQIVGAMKVMNTSMGKELKAIADAGGAIGVSSRGYGSVRMTEDGNMLVQDDFTLLTFDPVADPAEESAYPELQKAGEAEEPGASDDDEVKKEETTGWQEAAEVPAAEVKTEDVDRNTLNQALKAAKAYYTQAIKESSHKDALSRAVEEGYKHIGTGYDVKDFAIQVGAEVMTVKKQQVQEQAGSNMDQEQILNLIKSTVSESVSGLLAEKDLALNEAKDKILTEAQKTKQVQQQLDESKAQITKMEDVVKELGYGLYLQQHLGRHPKLKQIRESLGDLCDIPSLEELQNRIKVHIGEVTKVMEAEESKLKKLTEQVSNSARALQEANDLAKRLTEERDEAVQIGLEHASALYLETRLMGNPYATEIRARFKELSEKTKDKVDTLLREYRGRRVNESSDFHRVRRSLTHRPKDVEHDRLVENHVKDTQPAITEEVLQIQGENFNMNEIKRLAGIRK